MSEKMTTADIIGMREALKIRQKKEEFGGKASFSCLLAAALETIDDLLQKDVQREKDGFPRKIKFQRVVAGGKIISIPYVEEEKLIHGEFEPLPPEGETADEEGDVEEVPGHGAGEEGDVIGETPIRGEEQGEGESHEAGEGAGEHEIEEKAYQEGKKLARKYQLPNLKDKGKKVPTDEYVYDLIHRHRQSGQLLDKKATLKSVVKTNALLGRITKDDTDPAKMIVGPGDKIFRILSRERVWKSQAVVFFVRDYSGSMWGQPTKIIVEQHMMIYAWLMYQYESLVIPRFFVHDTEAREVSAKEYFGLVASGGTFIPAAYREVTKTVEGEALERDYNIFIFQGTDGDDWDDGSGRHAIPEIAKILSYVNRLGVCVLKHPYMEGRKSVFEQYVEKGGFLEQEDVFRMFVTPLASVTEESNIAALKVLLAQS